MNTLDKVNVVTMTFVFQIKIVKNFFLYKWQSRPPPKTVVIARTKEVTGWRRSVIWQKFQKVTKGTRNTTEKKETSQRNFAMKDMVLAIGRKKVLKKKGFSKLATSRWKENGRQQWDKIALNQTVELNFLTKNLENWTCYDKDIWLSVDSPNH